jgi:hypothetical protein
MSEDLTKDSLQKSVKIVGELYPVLTNQDGKILDGSHRIESNPKHYRKIVQTKNRMEEILVRLHAHHRRQIPQEETKAMLVELAKELEKDGIPTENVTAELYKLVPYSERYVRLLLPEMYKQPEKVEAAKISAELLPHTVKSKVQCPGCLKVFDSGLEYKIHWSHNHPGPAPAPLTQPSNVEETPLAAPMEEPKAAETASTASTPLTASTLCTEPKPKVTRLEPEVIPEGCPICPCCGSSLDPAEYQEIKQAVAVKYGKQIQTLLFPPLKKNSSIAGSVLEVEGGAQ